MEKGIDFALVHHFGCFQSLNAEQIGALAAHVEEVHLCAGEVLFRQGDVAESSYLLLSGEVRIQLATPAEGDGRTLATLGPGAILGEVGPLVKSPRTATAVASADSRLWRISTGTFHDALQRGEAWVTSLLLATAQALAGRLRGMNEALVDLAAEMRRNESQPQVRKAVAEIEELRRRLATEWTF
ncbi:MAG: cyclic nucleotide-binding domain-containing protein [Verrucomicrobia bacterium]|nr:cyclic nucleotide-binding domain-containing protein [Verrucomicrobiota bacterium]